MTQIEKRGLTIVQCIFQIPTVYIGMDFLFDTFKETSQWLIIFNTVIWVIWAACTIILFTSMMIYFARLRSGEEKIDE